MNTNAHSLASGPAIIRHTRIGATSPSTSGSVQGLDGRPGPGSTASQTGLQPPAAFQSCLNCLSTGRGHGYGGTCPKEQHVCSCMAHRASAVGTAMRPGAAVIPLVTWGLHGCSVRHAPHEPAQRHGPPRRRAPCAVQRLCRGRARQWRERRQHEQHHTRHRRREQQAEAGTGLHASMAHMIPGQGWWAFHEASELLVAEGVARRCVRCLLRQSLQA